MSTVRRATSQPKEVTRDSINEWEKTRPSLKALNDATLKEKRGFTIAKEDAVRIAGGEKEFQKVAIFWKRSILWLLGITIEYEHAIKGYRFIEVESHLIRRHDRLLKSAEKKHREESLRLGLMRDADFENDHQRRLRVFQMNQHSDTAGKLEAQREHNRIALKQPETLPRISGNGEK